MSENHLFPPVHIGLINAVLNARSAGLLLGGSISLCLGLDVVPTGRDTAGGSECENDDMAGLSIELVPRSALSLPTTCVIKCNQTH